MLLSCNELGRSYGARTLFEGLTFGIHEGDRIGLIGPNGAGKTSLLATLAGVEEPDQGRVSTRKRLALGFLAQSPEFQAHLTPTEAVQESLADLDLPEHERAGRVMSWLGRAGFTGDEATIATLSGGWKKRLALACELARQPDLLILDEPTNHLDLEGILWLEELLVTERISLMVVSHDRLFLQNVTNRLMELNPVWPGGLYASTGTYADFLEKREGALHTQKTQQATLANVVRREIDWLRRGPKARTTKANARIKKAEQLQDDLADLKSRNSTVKADARIDFSSSGRKSKILVEAQSCSAVLGGKTILSGVDLKIVNGQRLGIVGSNGSGKTTLLKLLGGEIAADSGTVKLASGLVVVRFEQDRESLDPTDSLKRALAPEGDMVIYRGQQVHVAGWAQRFLFRPEQLEVPVSRLSGGEKARIQLARLMLRPADLLLLDEPTNDLDIGTLEVLEESLVEFPGALVLVTHDRYLLDRVSDSLVAVNASGQVETFGDLAQWQASRKTSKPATGGSKKAKATTDTRAKPRPKKLSYKEKREMEGMEEQILLAEATLEGCREEAEDPAIMSSPNILQEKHAALARAQEDVDRLYARWSELENKIS